MPILIKKAGESNGFICDEANKALSAMTHSVSEARAIASLISAFASHRNPAARAKAAAQLAKALELMGYGRLLHSRELERVLPVLPTLLSEGLSETRAAAKAIIVGLTKEARAQPAESERLERLLRRFLSEPAYRKLRDSIDLASATPANSIVAGGLKVNGGGSGGRKTEGRRGGASGMSVSASGAADGRRGNAAGGEGTAGAGAASTSARGDSGGGGDDGGDAMERLTPIFGKLGSSDWLARKEGVTALADLATEHGELLCSRGSLLLIFDHLTPRLTDSNSKVRRPTPPSAPRATPRAIPLPALHAPVPVPVPVPAPVPVPVPVPVLVPP